MAVVTSGDPEARQLCAVLAVLRVLRERRGEGGQGTPRRILGSVSPQCILAGWRSAPQKLDSWVFNPHWLLNCRIA